MPPSFPKPWIDPQRIPQFSGQADTWLISSAVRPGEKYVAKVVKSPNVSRRARFMQEIRTCQELKHPNIAQILATGETENSKTPFFVMPYYRRGTLENERASRGLGSTLETLELFRQISSAIAFAHESGVVHRDLKPANIFIDSENAERRAIVGDFGLCFRHEGHANVTESWELVGARMYMPPEWRDGPVVNPAASGDVYSLGKILYWMYGGQTTDREECSIRPDRKLRKQIRSTDHSFAAIDDLISKMVIEDPAKRIQNASVLTDQVSDTLWICKRGGRDLDLSLKQACVFCQHGTYKLLEAPNGANAFGNQRGWQLIYSISTLGILSAPL